ncbi:MAG: hypothetical protein HYY24_08170 [Verrucomicrobia bacterium]|nr:hypothetical protein [Verrucomicrobiota bacterium]
MPFLAVGAFAGLRSAEIGRLDLSEVHRSEIGDDQDRKPAHMCAILECATQWRFGLGGSGRRGLG